MGSQGAFRAHYEKRHETKQMKKFSCKLTNNICSQFSTNARKEYNKHAKCQQHLTGIYKAGYPVGTHLEPVENPLYVSCLKKMSIDVVGTQPVVPAKRRISAGFYNPLVSAEQLPPTATLNPTPSTSKVDEVINMVAQDKTPTKDEKHYIYDPTSLLAKAYLAEFETLESEVSYTVEPSGEPSEKQLDREVVEGG